MSEFVNTQSGEECFHEQSTGSDLDKEAFNNFVESIRGWDERGEKANPDGVKSDPENEAIVREMSWRLGVEVEQWHHLIYLHAKHHEFFILATPGVIKHFRAAGDSEQVTADSSWVGPSWAGALLAMRTLKLVTQG